MLSVRGVRAFADNYVWLIDSPRTPGRVLAVDPGDAQPVIMELTRSGDQLAGILLTHHHDDHIGGAEELMRRFDVPVFAPDDERIRFAAHKAQDGEVVEFPELGLAFKTLLIPGHTLSHIALWGHGAVFCGDTLFSAGCGRMFEGTAEQMDRSLNRLKALPADTQVFCGHEYTENNLRFARTVEPDNQALASYQTKVQSLRARNEPTVPSQLSLEIALNPFLRCAEPSVKRAAETHARHALSSEAQVLGTLRAWKDNFR